MNNLFLIITANKYPNGDAGAIRQHAFAKIFKELGYNPLVIGIGESTSFMKSEYDGIDYYSVRYSWKNIFFRFLGRFLFSFHVKRIITKISPKDIRGILIVSGDEQLFCYIEHYSKMHNISLYHDSVEWYSPTEFKNGKKNREYVKNNNLNEVVINHSYKVFAISSFLYNYFSSRNISALRVPVIMDVKNIKCEKNKPTEIINIVYAGSIGGKDHIAEFIKAIEITEEKIRAKIRFYVIGSTQEQYEKKFGKVEPAMVDSSIFFVGRVSRNAVLEYLKKADFTFLLRPENERYSKAGFPTKIVESLASGTPVICNYTSDLDMYLRNGENSVIVEACTVDACCTVLKRIANTSVEKRLQMRQFARQTAEEYFDLEKYIKLFGAFIKR